MFIYKMANLSYMLLLANVANTKRCKNLKVTESLVTGYSSESTTQHYSISLDGNQKCSRPCALDELVASTLEGLKMVYLNLFF